MWTLSNPNLYLLFTEPKSVTTSPYKNISPLNCFVEYASEITVCITLLFLNESLSGKITWNTTQQLNRRGKCFVIRTHFQIQRLIFFFSVPAIYSSSFPGDLLHILPDLYKMTSKWEVRSFPFLLLQLPPNYHLTFTAVRFPRRSSVRMFECSWHPGCWKTGLYTLK